MVILENIDIDIDIDKAILQNIDIDKISNRFKFGISNRAIDKYRREGCGYTCPIIGYNGTNIVPIIRQISLLDLYGHMGPEDPSKKTPKHSASAELLEIVRRFQKC